MRRALRITNAVLSPTQSWSRRLSTIEHCPIPELCCQDMPAGLDIERKLDMSNSIPAYSEQIIVSTGKNDWSSRIEDDAAGGLVKRLKTLIGPKGKYNDPSRNLILTHSSFNAESSHATTSPTTPTTSAYLLPSFRHVTAIAEDEQGAEALARSIIAGDHASRDEAQPNHEDKQARVKDVLVLICSHGTRDSRCGILGPLLQKEFEDKLQHLGMHLSNSASQGTPSAGQTARVGLISHIGGHRWAGNVILAIPPHVSSDLAGNVIWYGRVEPAHVEGIIKETIINGHIIKELFRGGINTRREMLRL